MNIYENRIKEVLTNEIRVPDSYDSFIENVLNSDLKYKKIKKGKVLTLNLISLFLLCGVVTASVEVYNKVWKTPDRINHYYGENIINGIYHSENISAENILDEKQVEEKAYEILRRFNATDETISSIELIDNPSDESLYYRVNTDNESIIDIDARNSENFIMYLNKVSDTMPNRRFSKDEIVDISKKYAEKYDFDISKYDNIEVTYDGENYESSNRFSIYYRKTYNGVKITEKDAINIAVNKEREIGLNHEIIDISSNMAIIKMNGYAYLREKEYQEYYKARYTENYPLSNLIYYRVEDRIREVWKVKLRFSTDNNKEYNEDEFTYYIDVETGEIVGGE